MTSIMTNTAAMGALQTLRSINSQMETTQDRISSGLRVGSAADNAAYWSIATTMRSDNKALSTVEDALGLGAAKTDVAYTAMENSKDVVDEIKKKLVAASEPGVDKSKIQKEIKELQNQLVSVAKSASFSGENWVYNDANNTAATKSIVGSFNRDNQGNVSLTQLQFDTNKSSLIEVNASGSYVTNGTGLLSSNMEYKDATGSTVTAAYSVLTMDITNMTTGDLAGAISGVDATLLQMTDAKGNISNLKLSKQ